MRRLLFLFSSITLSLLLLAGCQPARRIPSDRYLLNRVEIRVAGREVKQSDLRPHLQQASNKRVLGGRFHLWLYNRSNLSKETRFQKGLRSVGEAPVLWDDDLTRKSNAQLLRYLETKGFYSAT
ncbi:MAG: outer membrane protein assembly factor, partial [Bacteroidales bacterium]